MKKFAFLLVLLPFLLNYSNSSAVTKKVKTTGNSSTVNFSSAATELNYNFIMPDSTGDTSKIDTDTLIKS